MEEKKISVVINTYNAEHHLRRVLDSVQGFDEVLICDMESTDSTIEIAQEYGCRIVTFPRRQYNIVEPARNFAIHQARYPWVLVVDADEIITPSLHNYLYDYLQRDNPAEGLRIPRKNMLLGHFMHGYYPDPNLRFFKKALTTWPEIIHAQPIVNGRIDIIPARKKQLAIVHLANECISERIIKMNRYTDNEISKRSGKNYSSLAFIHRPLFRFFKSYILKGGIRDGVPGLIYALLESVYQIVMLSKIYENREVEKK